MGNKNPQVSSKFISLILRHRPEVVGLKLDENGWADVQELIEQLRKSGRDFDFQDLWEIVESNNKRRFSFNEDQTRIRANQGHSVKIDLGLKPQVPPEILYHGTAQRFLDDILNSGLQKRNRHHVHLSADIPTAMQVGKRHGKPIVLEVRAGEMQRDGHLFYLSKNGVWLTDEVPVIYLRKK